MFLAALMEWQGSLELTEGLPAAAVFVLLAYLDLLVNVSVAAVATVVVAIAELESLAAPVAAVVVVVQMLAGLAAAR